MNYSDHIGIIGGGIAGLALACALSKFNIKTIVFERNDEISTYGAGISISKNASKILDRLNILEIFKKNSYQPGKSYWYYKNNKFHHTEVDIFTSSRQTLIKTLYDEYISFGGEVFFNYEISKISNKGKLLEFKNSKNCSVGHVAVCDGIKSNIRNELFTGDNKVTYSGFNAWRFIGKSANTNINFNLDSDSHIVNYPIDKNLNQSVVAISKNKIWDHESWKQEATIEEFYRTFDQKTSYLKPLINENQKIYKWGIFIRPNVNKIYTDNITLFGDAAHPIVPFLGQGGCMAIEDAYTFAFLLQKLNMNYSKAQFIYDKLRVPRNSMIGQMSLRQARLNHIKNYYFASLRNLIMKKTNLISKRMNNVWEYDAHQQVERELKNYSFD